MQDTLTIPTRETHMRTVSREIAGRRFIIARLGLHYIDGNRDAYWSATGDLYEPHGTWSGRARFNNDREPDGSGAIGAEIARAWPHLAPIVALHLADSHGFSMYAVENGRYHLENGHPEHAASLWRCTVDELPDVADVETYVEANRERWTLEAQEAWRLLQTL
jgi:hypothetical protein